jgi:hypothetical protein
MVAAVVDRRRRDDGLRGNPIARFVERHPTVKMLALSFLLLIGTSADRRGARVQHIPKGYIYFAMGFSVIVEALNLRMRKLRRKPIRLHERYAPARSAWCAREDSNPRPRV